MSLFFPVSLTHYLIFSVSLFAIGFCGLLLRRSLLMLVMSIELMLNAAMILFVLGASIHHSISAQVFVFFIMIVAAAEVAVGLSILIWTYHKTGSVDSHSIQTLKG